MDVNNVTENIIGASIEVHRALGPGLLESAYEECLCHELRLNHLDFCRQKQLPLVYGEKSSIMWIEYIHAFLCASAPLR
ncbi:MAG: GxxExxY protein [Thiotrichales bacterium]|nr:MAG: GxxExxY protein [Thiotrichales bacterium]